VRHVVEMRTRIEALDERVLGVDFQHRLRGRRCLARLLQEAREMPAHVALLDHQASR
jgi:hypothetical protein